MAVTTTPSTDVSQALAELLDGVSGLRVYWYVADTMRPPAVVIGQPEIDWLDNLSGWCAATFTFPLTVIVARNNDRDAQLALSRLVQEIATALDNPAVVGVRVIEPMDARPTTVSAGGTELPGYQMNVRVRA